MLCNWTKRGLYAISTATGKKMKFPLPLRRKVGKMKKRPDVTSDLSSPNPQQVKGKIK
jgi:hypothetical protein